MILEASQTNPKCKWNATGNKLPLPVDTGPETDIPHSCPNKIFQEC